MYRTILVPLDGESLGERALPFATAFARAMGAQIHLVRVVSLAPAPDLSPALAELAALVELERGEHYLGRVAADLQRREIAVTGAVRAGDVVERLREEVGRACIDLIVLATDDKTMLGRHGFGRVAEGLLHRLAIPVVMVRPWHAESSLRHLTEAGAQILVPLDGSPQAENAVTVATTFAVALGAELALLSVLPPAGDARQAARQEEAWAYLLRLGRRLAAEGYRVRCDVRVGDAAGEIIVAVRTHALDLVVMGTHGQTGREHALLGSVANAVVWTGAVPTVLIGGPPPDPAGGAVRGPTGSAG